MEEQNVLANQYYQKIHAKKRSEKGLSVVQNSISEYVFHKHRGYEISTSLDAAVKVVSVIMYSVIPFSKLMVPKCDFLEVVNLKNRKIEY